ncbi:MAG: hypothetical protein ACO377_12960 [Pseudomonadales bacterium]
MDYRPRAMRRAEVLRRVLMLLVGLSLMAGLAAEPRTFYVGDIKAAMDRHIAQTVDDSGVFHLRDDRTGEVLALRFVKIHDPVRRIDDNTYFACTDFSLVKDEEQLYDIDFWLRPENGELLVYKTKVHKEPRRSLLYGWYKQPRYTFVDDKVVELY